MNYDLYSYLMSTRTKSGWDLGVASYTQLTISPDLLSKEKVFLEFSLPDLTPFSLFPQLSRLGRNLSAHLLPLPLHPLPSPSMVSNLYFEISITTLPSLHMVRQSCCFFLPVTVLLVILGLFAPGS